MVQRNKGFIAIVCLIAVLAGCAGKSTVDPDHPYAAELEHAQKNAESDFEKAVFSDGEVTRDEYLEALERYVQCIKEKGSHVELEDRGGVFIYVVSGDTTYFDSVSNECSAGTTDLIEPIYVTELGDPHKKGNDTVTAECFVRADLVDAPFTGDDLNALLDLDSQGKATDPISSAIISDPDFGNCLTNPGYVPTP